MIIIIIETMIISVLYTSFTWSSTSINIIMWTHFMSFISQLHFIKMLHSFSTNPTFFSSHSIILIINHHQNISSSRILSQFSFINHEIRKMGIRLKSFNLSQSSINHDIAIGVIYFINIFINHRIALITIHW